MENEVDSYDKSDDEKIKDEKIKDDKIINKIKSYLKKADETIHKNIKILTIINLMHYLRTEICFIKRHEKFKLCVLQKCMSLKEQLPENMPPLLLEQFNQSINIMNNLLKS